jgi:hypothetical protein
MADSLFDSNIQTLINTLTSDIPSATSAELLVFGRMIKSIKQSENINLESLLNSRVNTLMSGSPSVEDLSVLSNAVGKLIDLTTPDTATGKELPEQDGQNDKYLTTDGTNMSWDTLEFSDFQDIDHGSLGQDEYLSYNSTSGKYEGVATIPTNITSTIVANQASLPSGSLGDFGTATDTSTLYYHNGTTWIEFGTF